MPAKLLELALSFFDTDLFNCDGPVAVGNPTYAADQLNGMELNKENCETKKYSLDVPNQHVRLYVSRCLGGSTEQSTEGEPYDVLTCEYTIKDRIFQPDFTFLRPPDSTGHDSNRTRAGSAPVRETQRKRFRLFKPAIVSYETIRTSLEACNKHHGDLCSSHQTLGVPGFKVIDCLTRTIVSPPTKDFKYAALSYVWGEIISEGTSREAFPRTIEDSMVVTLEMGLRYLWVDRYVSLEGLRFC